MTTKQQYFIHYEMLKFLIRMDVSVTFLSGWECTQEPIFEKYINHLSDMRAYSDSPTEKLTLKNLSNSIYGKTLSNPRNRFNFTYMTSDDSIELRQKKIACQNSVIMGIYISSKFITPDIMQIKSRKRNAHNTNPILIGSSVLDHSKLRMLSLYYEKLKPVFKDKIEINYHDTDSLFLEIHEKNPFKKMSKLKNHFDFSVYDQNHVIHKYLSQNEIDDGQGRVGSLKDDFAKQGVFSFQIILQKKQYSNLLLSPVEGEDGNFVFKQNITCKRLDEKQLSIYNYLECLLSNSSTPQNRYKINSTKGGVNLSKQRISGLNNHDNSGFLHSCQVHMSAFGSS